MLDVHAPHESIDGWRSFFVHLATITIGLLIALGLEAAVECIHHHNEVTETRQALQRELQENRTRFADNTAYFRNESAMLQNNLLVLHYLQQHPGTPQSQLPGVLLWTSSNARMEDSAWKTATQTGITALMPQDEVMKTSELYGYFERIDRAHEEEADALIEAIGYTFQDSNPTHLTPAQIDEECALTERVLSKHLRHAFLMQNLAEQYPEFKPSPEQEELEKLLHLPELNNDPELAAARALTRQRMEKGAPPPPTN
jgi:GTPase SAR1 family protein